ncbi:MAG: hypothetical protein JWM11_6144 [Planctomycetaceae bacterium]|nr:hypothetical protein [Planctomycetaceae bacterium]
MLSKVGRRVILGTIGAVLEFIRLTRQSGHFCLITCQNICRRVIPCPAVGEVCRPGKLFDASAVWQPFRVSSFGFTTATVSRRGSVILPGRHSSEAICFLVDLTNYFKVDLLVLHAGAIGTFRAVVTCCRGDIRTRGEHNVPRTSSQE